MLIGDRLRALREEKSFSQGDIEKRTGLLRPYISRVENGHTVPAIETLEKFARALEIPIYQLFVGVSERPALHLKEKYAADPKLWGSVGRDARALAKFCQLLERMAEPNRKLLLFMAQEMAKR
jgi:transcriptional regulator with XRE-family HTH domain